MFVCLKYIFATEGLDSIILREYASLPEHLQDIYRYVAAIQAAGATPHRQLIIRQLGIQVDRILGILRELEDIIEEREISSAEGIYEWSTRHEVVAQTIAKYKFADEDELYNALFDIIDNINPTVYIELKTLRGLCNREFGVQRISSPESRINLYEAILTVAPSERVPRHRLVYEYLNLDDFDSVETVIKAAEEIVGIDPPLTRYRIKLLIDKAERMPDILEVDRRALLIQAKQEALRAVERYPEVRYMYEALGDVTVAWHSLTRSKEWLQETIPIIRKGANTLLDPALDETLRYLERLV